jgi:hypothetical protein
MSCSFCLIRISVPSPPTAACPYRTRLPEDRRGALIIATGLPYRGELNRFHIRVIEFPRPRYVAAVRVWSWRKAFWFVLPSKVFRRDLVSDIVDEIYVTVERILQCDTLHCRNMTGPDSLQRTERPTIGQRVVSGQLAYDFDMVDVRTTLRRIGQSRVSRIRSSLRGKRCHSRLMREHKKARQSLKVAYTDSVVKPRRDELMNFFGRTSQSRSRTVLLLSDEDIAYIRPDIAD